MGQRRQYKSRCNMEETCGTEITLMTINKLSIIVIVIHYNIIYLPPIGRTRHLVFRFVPFFPM
jgi:hypothetical protein